MVGELVELWSFSLEQLVVVLPKLLSDHVVVHGDHSSLLFVAANIDLLGEERRAFAKHRWEVVVVDIELGEEELVLVGREGSPEPLLRLGVFHSLLENQVPETGVVEVVDVDVSLSPAQVIFDVLVGWIKNNASVKCWRILERLLVEPFAPVENVRRGKQAVDVGENL